MKTATRGPDELNSALCRTQVGCALGQLSAERRAVVCRSYYQGWTTGQIAADLGIAEASAKSRLHYALRDLHQRLIDNVSHTRKD